MKKLMMTLMVALITAIAMFGQSFDSLAASTAFTIDYTQTCYSEGVPGSMTVWCSSVEVETELYPIDDTDIYVNFTWPYFGFSDILEDEARYGRSKIIFYDSSHTMIYFVNLYLYSEHIDYFIFYLDDVFDSSIPEDLSYFSIKMIYDLGDDTGGNILPEGFATFIEEYAVYEIDGELEWDDSLIMSGYRNWDDRIFYYFDFQLFMALPAGEEVDPEDPLGTVIVPIIQPPDPLKYGYKFQGWYTFEGLQYDWGDPIPINDDDNYMLYGGIVPTRSVGADEDNLEEGIIITNLLTMIGFNNDAGRTIVFTMIMLTLSVALVSIKVPLFVIALASVVVTVAFIFLGWLPTYAAIIMIITSFALMVISVTRSERSDSL